MHFLEPMIPMPSERQIQHLTKVFWDTNRPGGDCESGGVWQPRFLHELAEQIADDAGIPFSSLGAKIDKEKPQPTSRNWHMRRFLQGE